MLKYFKCALQLLEVLRKIVVLRNTIEQEQHTVYIYIYIYVDNYEFSRACIVVLTVISTRQSRSLIPKKQTTKSKHWVK